MPQILTKTKRSRASFLSSLRERFSKSHSFLTKKPSQWLTVDNIDPTIGVKILDSDLKIAVTCIPKLPASLAVAPKGTLTSKCALVYFFSGFTADVLAGSTKFLLTPDRIDLAIQFDAVMTNPEAFYGKLLSGPNGVGKSSHGLLNFFSQFVQGRPILYVTSSIFVLLLNTQITHNVNSSRCPARFAFEFIVFNLFVMMCL